MAAPTGFIDLREVKAEARRLLPPGHPVREALQAEPDELPRAVALVKLETYGRLLYRV